jgi:glycine betaine catabolism B
LAQPIHFRAKVDKVKRHTSDVLSYRLKADKLLPRFYPGQFIHLALDPYHPASFWPESRIFSVANSVNDHCTIELTISRQGRFTSRILEELEEGSEVWAKGPYGEFRVDGVSGCSHPVLIAGGTGITPFCAFMDAALQLGTFPAKGASLYYGAKTEELLIFRELADRCAAQFPVFHVRYFSEASCRQNESLRQGTIELGAIMEETREYSNRGFYLSGPRRMIETFSRRLTDDFGILSEKVFTDAWQ